MGGPCVRRVSRLSALLVIAATIVLQTAGSIYPTGSQVPREDLAIVLQDYARVPLSSRTDGAYPPSIDYSDQLSRVSVLRYEPGTAGQFANRVFVADLNRNLYIVDTTTRAFTTYINFEEVFPKLTNNPSYGGGLATFAFDPAYENNGRFYTVHIEGSGPASPMPTNASLPGLDLTGYQTTASIDPPVDTVGQRAVLIEWTDSDLSNTTFEGTAREVLRIGVNHGHHAIADMLFNPTAQSGDDDYGNLYVAVGDGGAGQSDGPTHTIPQRLDALPGKILRITPDLGLRPADALSANGRYRIPVTGPDANPFADLNLAGVKTEIFAYGFRNPQRMSWDPVSGALLVADIGMASWEEIDIVKKGGNYGP
jgi:hypothetical protein